jgi:hypothetical protein
MQRHSMKEFMEKQPKWRAGRIEPLALCGRENYFSSVERLQHKLTDPNQPEMNTT